MSGLFQRDPRAGAFLGGDRVSGQDIRDQNGLFFIPFFGLIAHFLLSYRRAIHRQHYQKFPGSSRSRQDARRQHWRTTLSPIMRLNLLIFIDDVGSYDI